MRSALGRILRRVPVDGSGVPAFAATYDEVFESLGDDVLRADPDPLDAADLGFGFQDRSQRNPYFLGFYTEEGARLAFERYGFWQLLRERGFEPLLVGDVSDPDEHWLRIYDRVAEPEHLLVELAMGFREPTLPDGSTVRLLFINWLMMQDPRRTLADEGRAPLPDQEHPGLGLFSELAYLLRLMGLRLGCDGLLNHPRRYHNGVLYGRFMKFADPVVEGRFRAVQRDLAGVPLVEATRAVHDGRVVDTEGVPYVWQSEDQILPITRPVRDWLGSRSYRERAEEARQSVHYRLVEPG